MHGAVRQAFLVILLLGCVMLFVGHLAEDAPRWQKQLWNLGHIGLFAGLVMACWPHLPGGWWSRAAQALAGGALVGVAVELLQARIGRDATLRDVMLDLVGAALGVLIAGRAGLGWRQRLLLWLPLLVALALALRPFLLSAWDAREARRQFPLLAGFESAAEHNRVRLYGGTWGSVRDGALRLFMGGGKYSGFVLDQMPEDWRGYGALRMVLENPAPEPLTLTCRIHDRVHERRGSPREDRFNRRLRLPPGVTQVYFPLADVAAAPVGRRMAMDEIAEFGCFITAVPKRRPLRVLAVALE